MKDHPRLFASVARFEALKSQVKTDPVSEQLFTLILREAKKALGTPKMDYSAVGPARHGMMRQVQGRILVLAMAYRLTEGLAFVERAKKELLELAARPDWATDHFLTTAEATLGAAIGLDWLHAFLSEDERTAITQAIVRLALLPSLDVKEGNKSWVDAQTNWNQVCHGGLVCGALAIAESEPELAQKIIERAVQNVPKAGVIYAPDGAYPEGPSYWSYGTSFQVLLIEALRSALGTSHSLEKSPGFLKTADFRLQMIGPTGVDFNFADYHKEEQNEPIFLWFARELRRRDLAERELSYLQDRSLNRHFPLELLWWQPELPKKKALPLRWVSRGMMPLGVLRSTWDDPSATYVALKGGKANHSHAHQDAGSFILEADGVRWAVDLGTESYATMRAAKLDLFNTAPSSNRWSAFRNGADGHNVLQLGTTPPDVDGFVTIRAARGNGVVANLTQHSLNRTNLQIVSRGLPTVKRKFVCFSHFSSIIVVSTTRPWPLQKTISISPNTVISIFS